MRFNSTPPRLQSSLTEKPWLAENLGRLKTFRPPFCCPDAAPPRPAQPSQLDSAFPLCLCPSLCRILLLSPSSCSSFLYPEALLLSSPLAPPVRPASEQNSCFRFTIVCMLCSVRFSSAEESKQKAFYGHGQGSTGWRSPSFVVRKAPLLSGTFSFFSPQ
eukprot:1830742-Rhodomonas_salina.1